MKQNNTWVSWNENLKHDYSNLFKVTTEVELIDAISKSDKIRFFGSKQSSADIAANLPNLIDINAYDKILSYDENNLEITVQSGIKLSTLLDAVEAKGWCIPCLPDINTVTIGGAIATGTHGTSGKLLSEYMVSCRLVLANGSIKEIKEGDDLMDAVRVSIGTLGVMSTLTFKCETIYTLHVKEGPENDNVWLPKINERLEKHDFLRVLWLPHTNNGYVIIGDKIDPNTPVKTNMGPSYLKHRRNTSKALYKYSGKYPWITAIANKLLYFGFFRSKKEHKGSLYQATVTKSRGSTLELAEWTVALDKFPDLFKELKTLINKWSNDSFIHIPMDVRFVKKDKSWLSYAYNQDTVTVGCVCRNAADADSYEAFHTVEQLFLKYGGRPHWGKRFAAKDKTLSNIYPKWEAFKKLRKELDPNNKFLNPYLSDVFSEKEHVLKKVYSKKQNVNEVA